MIKQVFTAYGLLVAVAVFAQETVVSHQIYIEKVMETLAAEIDEEIDLSQLAEALDYYLQNPVNLNTATREQLAQLHILNDYQVAALLDYRRKTGAIHSIYELAYLPGFREQDIQLLQPFVVFGPVPERKLTLKELKERQQHEVILRYQRTMEEQKGYIALPDSVLAEDPDKSRYLGSPDKLYIRYRIRASDRIGTCLLMEKDAGEEFFRGSNATGFDFYSGYVSVRSQHSPVREVILGDYHVQLGQGLLAWSSYSFGKSTGLAGLSRSGIGITGNRSTDENRFFRGVAINAGKGTFSCTGFVSVKRIDAQLTDSAGFSTLYTSGIHATPSQIANENSVQEQVYGLGFRYTASRLQLGLNGIYQQYDRNKEESDRLYQSYDFSGKSCAGVSFDYKYLAGKLQLFGEVARSHDGYALLNGALFYLQAGTTIGMLHRYYQKEYAAYWSNAFGEGSRTNNEHGYFLSAEAAFGKSTVRAYTDIFAFPWLRYRVNAPSQGYELYADLETQLGPVWLIVRYKSEEKPVNITEEGANLYRMVLAHTDKFKLRILWKLDANWQLQNRFEVVHSQTGSDTAGYGFFVCQDIHYQQQGSPLAFAARAAWFHSPSYDTRLYVYERDLLYMGGTEMHYGGGWRFMGLVKYKIGRNIGVGVKLGRTYYPQAEESGSGLNEIADNHRTEVKAQLIMKF